MNDQPTILSSKNKIQILAERCTGMLGLFYPTKKLPNRMKIWYGKYYKHESIIIKYECRIGSHMWRAIMIFFSEINWLFLCERTFFRFLMNRLEISRNILFYPINYDLDLQVFKMSKIPKIYTGNHWPISILDQIR